jgi:uncharacterized protein (DUF1684 family)
MAKRLTVWLPAALCMVILGACGQSGATFDSAEHADEVMQWREYRLGSLLNPFGYLNQTGLFWLKAGQHSFGSDASNDVVFPGEGAGQIGVFTVDDDGVSMSISPLVDVRHGQEKVTTLHMAADTSEHPVVVTHDTLAWVVVEREGRYGIRLRDFELPFVKTFGPLTYFDVDPSFRVEAVLRRYPEPIIARSDTVIEGLEYRPESPGVVAFELGGKEFLLEAFTVGDQLFFVFGDQTNRDETYGAGRFLYSDAPGKDGRTILDFNKSYSPPCAFNDFSTCPIASPRNTLSVRVEAGEWYDPALHYSAEH